SVRGACGRPPSGLRPRVRRPRPRVPGRARPDPGGPGAHEEAVPGGTWLTLWLACREPFDGQSLLRFLAARAIPGVEEVAHGRYMRTVRVPGGSAVIELAPPPAAGSGENGPAGRAPIGRAGRTGPAGRPAHAPVLPPA